MPDFDDIINYDKNWTLSMWVYDEDDGNTVIIGGGDGGSGYKQIIIKNNIVKISPKADSSYDLRINFIKPELNFWNHYLIEYSDNKLSLYINDKKIGESYSEILSDYYPNTYFLTIGALNTGHEKDILFNFRGKVDDIRIYNKILSKNQKNDLYNNILY